MYNTSLNYLYSMNVGLISTCKYLHTNTNIDMTCLHLSIHLSSEHRKAISIYVCV